MYSPGESPERRNAAAWALWSPGALGIARRLPWALWERNTRTRAPDRRSGIGCQDASPDRRGARRLLGVVAGGTAEASTRSLDASTREWATGEALVEAARPLRLCRQGERAQGSEDGCDDGSGEA